MQENYNCWFHNTTFVNCPRKAQREGAGQAPLHGYYVRRAVNRQPGFRSGDSLSRAAIGSTHTHTQTNKRTNNQQTDNQTSKPARKQASKQAHEQTTTQANKQQTNKQIKQTNKQTNRQTSMSASEQASQRTHLSEER